MASVKAPGHLLVELALLQFGHDEILDDGDYHPPSCLSSQPLHSPPASALLGWCWKQAQEAVVQCRKYCFLF